jgi:hypothetical protein
MKIIILILVAVVTFVGFLLIFTGGCDEKAQYVIEKHNLYSIHSCTTEKINYGTQTASIVEILYGPGQDCISGCFYNSDYSIVFQNNTIKNVDPSFFSREDNLASFIWEKIKIPVHSRPSIIAKISSKELVNYNGLLAIHYTFNKYINGEIFVNENGLIEGNITPSGMTLEDAKQIAVNELEEKGYQLDYSVKDGFPLSSNYDGDKPCWIFYAYVKPVDIRRCTVTVCLDKKTDLSCQ